MNLFLEINAAQDLPIPLQGQLQFTISHSTVTTVMCPHEKQRQTPVSQNKNAWQCGDASRSNPRDLSLLVHENSSGHHVIPRDSNEESYIFQKMLRVFLDVPSFVVLSRRRDDCSGLCPIGNVKRCVSEQTNYTAPIDLHRRATGAASSQKKPAVCGSVRCVS